MNDDLRLYNSLTRGGNSAYNAIGRTSGRIAASGPSNDNFFTKRASSIGNAVGTTLSAPISLAHDIGENIATQMFLGDSKSRMNDVAKKYGYNTYHDVWDARDKAEAAGDQATLDLIDNTINPELQAQANANASEAAAKAKGYEDYRKNNLISQNINQDRGKFAGSAINTLSTMADVLLPSAGVAFNSVQGGLEGVADELEQSGFKDFDWGRAGQNALVGAATGGVVGAFNKGLSNSLAKRGGNLFKGGNAVTRGLNDLGSKTALGRVGSTIATGAGRGALSGAVGGATGAGLSAALNNQDVLGSALQGAAQGAQQGAFTGATMAGANMAISRTPGVGKFMRDVNQAQEDWRNSGSNFDERLTNTLTSGDSAVGDWLMGKRQSKLLGAAGNIGNSVRPIDPYYRDLKTQMFTTKEGTEIPLSIRNWETPEEVWRNFVESPEGARYKNETFMGASEISAPQAEPEYAGDQQTKFFVTKEGSEVPLTVKSWETPEEVWRDFVNGPEGSSYKNETLDNSYTRKDVNNLGTKSNYSSQEIMDAGVKALGLGNKYTGSSKQSQVQRIMEAGLDALNLESPYDSRVSSAPTTAKEYSPNKPVDFESSVNDYNEASSFINEAVTGGRKVTDAKLISQFKQLSPTVQQEVLNIGGEFLSDDFMLKLNNASSPTTAKGWLKKAGERIVEDINNRGVGLSIKNVGGQQIDTDKLFDDYGEDYARLYDAKEGADAEIATNVDYYDNVLSRNKEAMDLVRDLVSERQDAFTSDREVAALVNTLRKNGIIDSDTSTQGTYARQQSRPQTSPETELYRTVTGDKFSQWDNLAQEAGYSNYDEALQAYQRANQNTAPKASNVLDWIDNKQSTQVSSQSLPEVVPSKASKESRLRNAQGKELLKQYGTVDQPMARATRAAETLQELSDMGFTKPGDVEKISSTVTGANGAVSKLNDNIIKSAKPVNTFDGETSGQTIDDFIDSRIEKNYLSGTNEGKAVKRALKAFFNALPSHTNGSIGFEDSASDAFELVQQLEASSAELKGRGGQTYHRPTTTDLHQAAVIDDVADLLKERIYNGADVKTAITPEVVANLKSLDPGNKTWAQTVDNFASTAKSPRDIRAFQRPFVRANKYIENQYIQAATFGGRMASGLSEAIPTTKAGVARQLINAAWNSGPAVRAKAKVLGYAADKAAANSQTPASGPTTQANTQLGVVTPASSTPAGQTNAQPYNPTTQLYNAIGRTTGLTNAEQAKTANYLANAAQEAEVVPKVPNAGANTLEGLISPTTTGSATSVYNSIYGNGNTQTASTGYFQPTGDYWTDILATAMSKAIDADDVTAFASLYGMYQDALSNIQKQSSSTQKLSSTQQRANAAMNSLERLSGMTPDLAYNLSNIPLIGGIATLGGNDYESEAKSLAQQIGYMVSGSNIKDSEAEAIGKSYVPQPWDNEQVRQNKLRRAYEIISQYQNGYAE